MKIKILLLICFAFAKADFSHAQSQDTKLEKEERIKSQYFPADAVKWVKLFADGKRIKYYREYDGERISYEAKFRKNRQRYSMEYSKEGVLEDVEIEVKKRKIEKTEWEKIQQHLDSTADRWRVEKIQQQYLMPQEGYGKLKKQIEIQEYQYLEMLVAFKEKRKIYRKELLFNRKGELISERKVKRVAYDFLLF